MSEPPIPIRNIIYQGDCRNILSTWPKGSVDMVFADPPYNLQLKQELWRPNMTVVDAVTDAWDQVGTFEDYDTFTREWLIAVRRVMKPTATIWVSGTYHNIFRVGSIMQDMGFWLLNTVAWHKINAMPNFRGTRLKNDLEFVIWAKYSEKSRYTFHHHQMKQFNDGKQLGSMWTIPATPGAERMKDDKGEKLHSTQKPEALLERIIIAASNPGDLILDPFMGTGTTGAVARRLRRDYVGVERNAAYIPYARRRIEAVRPIAADDPLIVDAKHDRPKRVPFRRLLERDYLRPGQELYFDSPPHTGILQSNGKIQVNGFTGSIHQTAVHLTGRKSCNGWKHWHFTDEATGQRRPLDDLRRRVRESASD